MDRREFLRLAAVASLSPLAACVGNDSEKVSGPRPSAAESPSPTLIESSSEPAPALGWKRIGAKGPGPRRDYTFAAAGAESAAILFGGRAAGEPLGDLWSFAGGAWRQISAEGPTPRFGHNSAYIGGRLIVFGGQGGAGVFFNDLWSFDTTKESWTQLAESGQAPSARYGSGGTAVGSSLTISHGFTDAGRFDDTWSFSKAWTDVSPATGPRPIERCLHRLAYVKGLDRLVLFGGQTNADPFLGDTWLYDPGAEGWTQVKGPAPSPRKLFAAAATNSALYLFGGNGNAGELGDLWSFNGERWSELRQSKTRPSARSGVEFASQVGSMLLFGGSDASGEVDDLWELTTP
jgi:galactose oxidase-like protein